MTLEREKAGNAVMKLETAIEDWPMAEPLKIAVYGHPHARALKLKLLGDGDDAARVEAVRAARPEVWLSVDGNQGLDVASLQALIPVLEAARISMIEQPLPVAQDAALAR